MMARCIKISYIQFVQKLNETYTIPTFKSPLNVVVEVWGKMSCSYIKFQSIK